MALTLGAKIAIGVVAGVVGLAIIIGLYIFHLYNPERSETEQKRNKKNI